MILGDRLMVGQRPLKPLIGVRVPVPEYNLEGRSGGMVDTTDLKSVARKGVRVQVPPPI